MLGISKNPLWIPWIISSIFSYLTAKCFYFDFFYAFDEIKD